MEEAARALTGRLQEAIDEFIARYSKTAAEKAREAVRYIRWDIERECPTIRETVTADQSPGPEAIQAHRLRVPWFPTGFE